MAWRVLLAAAALAPAVATADAFDAEDYAQVPAGYKLEVFATLLPKARQLAVKSDGTVAVGSLGQAVYLLRDTNGDGTADWRRDLPGLAAPHGVAWLGETLYIGTTPRILRAPDVLDQLESGERVALEIVVDDLPTSNHHGARNLAIDANGLLLVGLGVPCNICMPPDEELTGTLRRYDPASGAGETVAYGFRNSVGFDWHPQTGDLWATDHGRDWLGDDLPSDELNRITRDGQHFGYPYCHQGDFSDPEFGEERPCSEFEPPALKTGPHVANNGVHFYRGEQLPIAAGRAFIALHGSWNRSDKIGYRVDAIEFSADGAAVADTQVFVGGWLDDDQVHARPVDIDQLPDGSLLVSDDYNGAIYRISPIDG